MRKIVIGTSIAPYEIEKQKECIGTWLSSGFEVISFNCIREIEIIRPYFKDMDVEFYEIDRSAKEICGKELPFMQDILDVVSNRADAICGYCNSDIYFYKVTPEIYEYIRDEANNSIVVIHRNEVENYECIGKGDFRINFDGIDCFFADKRVVNDLYGLWAYVQMVWDTFLIIRCAQKKTPVKTLLNPIMFHKRHSVRWDSNRTKKAFDCVNAMYFNGALDSFKDIFYLKYQYLLEYSSYIVYADYRNKKILFIGDEESVKLPLYKQTFDIAFSNKILNDKKYDFIVYAQNGLVYDTLFFNFIIYLFEVFPFCNLRMGVFYWMTLDEKSLFCQLNKNLTTLSSINSEMSTWTTICAVDGSVNREMLYPVLRKEISLKKNKLIKKYVAPSCLFIMPAGYRASEWLSVYGDRIGSSIAGVIDNDIEKIGGKLQDYSIVSMNQAIEQGDDIGIIITTKYYQEEIREQIKMLSNNITIIDGDRIVWISDEGELFYVGNGIE